MSEPARVDVVVPTVGRPSLRALLDSLAYCRGPRPERVIVVNDRPGCPDPVAGGMPAALADRVKVVQGTGSGPAAARNIGWQASAAEWIAFLDDDVLVTDDWLDALHRDLAAAAFDVAGVQGHIRVPRPRGRRPTDWERNVAGLERAQWATADLAYRRLALETVGGFDERFTRAYREDADLGLRLVERGWRIERGSREIVHPVRAADHWVSIRLQAGNADDALMRAVHGRHWRARAGVPAGRRPRHLAAAGAGLVAVAARAAGRRRVARAAGALWAAGTAELAASRIAPGPRTADEVSTMLATSLVMPFVATFHWLRGLAALPEVRGQQASARHEPPQAVLFDRDGTLVEDVPYNGDPGRVRLRPGAREAVSRVVARGVPMAVVSNQSGVGRGLVTAEQVDAVNLRVQQLLGVPIPCFTCPHAPGDGCRCRKPEAGLLLAAAATLGVDPSRCTMIGDIGADVEAARAAGCRAILVPTPATRSEEIGTAPAVAMTLPAAVDLLLGGKA